MDRFIEADVNSKDYGEGLNLLLIKVYVEGHFEVYGPEQLVVGSYSKLRSETNAAFTVFPEDFQDKVPRERKVFLTTMVQRAVEEIYRKHGKKLNSYDFLALLNDLDIACKKYLQEP